MRLHRISTVAVAVVFLAALAGCAHHSHAPKIRPVKDMYRRAKNSLTIEHYGRAIAIYKQLLATYPFGKYATQSRLDLIYAYYKSGQPDETADTANRFEKQDPTSPYVPYALYVEGVAYATTVKPGPLQRVFGISAARRDPKNEKKAFQTFKRLITNYPHSKYVKRARQWMVFVRNRLAKFDLFTARFYLRRKIWVAAVDRAAYIVTHYSRSPSVKPALRIMVRGYRALGETDLANAAEKLYKHNFGS